MPYRTDERTMLPGFLTAGSGAGRLAATHPHHGHTDLIRESIDGSAGS
jgi:hypothetical protein